MAALHDYKDILRGKGAVSLANLKALKAGTKVLIPKTYALGRAMLQYFRSVLISFLPEAHAVLGVESVLDGLHQLREIFIGQLQHTDPKLGIAWILRYVQLVFQAWFEETWNTVGTAAAVGIPPPDLRAPLTKMSIGNMM